MPRIDLAFLERAGALAERGRYTVSPNPMVGAVVVRGGRVVGEGFHRRAGGPHAEVAALRAAGAKARGADLYLTLEPCVHRGRTPACAPVVVASGVRRVVVAAKDANPLVAGRGIAALRRAGLDVVLAPARFRRAEEERNEKFRAAIVRRRPFVLAKWASSLDGRIASARGESRWITGEPARRRALALREEYDAVLVGAGTVGADDPRLTRRLGRAGGLPHRRIVLDGKLRVAESARVLRGRGAIVVTAAPASHPKARRLKTRGVEVWSLPGRAPGRVDLGRLLDALGSAGMTSLMVEGGAETLGAFLEARLVDRIAVFLAPSLLGGRGALGAVGGRGFALADAAVVRGLRLERLGGDVLATGRLA